MYLNKNKVGFTVIELLAAITIGAILLTTLTGIYKHMRISTSIKEEKNYIYDNALHFLSFYKKDIKSAGYEEYKTTNGEINEGFILNSNQDITIIYDSNTTNRITHNYTYSANKVFVNGIPLVSKVSDINWTIDPLNSDRIITNIEFTGFNRDINGNLISESFKSINYK